MDSWLKRFDSFLNEAFVDAGVPSRVALEGVPATPASGAPSGALSRPSYLMGRGRWGPWGPHWGLQEAEGAYNLRLELPGVGKENVKVLVKDNMLRVEAQHQAQEQGKTWASHVESNFQRSLRLPEGVKPEEITAKMENGVLTVKLPKAEPVPAHAQAEIPVL